MSGLRSMTGFAVREMSLASGERVVLSMKAVNHRFLDLQFRLPHGLDALEVELRRLLKERLGRGHVELSLEVKATEAEGRVQIDVEVFRSVVEAVQAAARAAGIAETVEAGAVLRVPGVLVSGGRGARVASAELRGAELLRAVPALTVEVLDAFQATREREGAGLRAELLAATERLSALLEQGRALRAGVREEQFKRIRGRVAELLGETAVSEERLLTEAALLAERSDVDEEMVRLRTHIAHFQGLLGEQEPVGKRMDFLLQEFNRESNTLLAKSGSAAGATGLSLVALGLEMKAEIERMREQVQNVE